MKLLLKILFFSCLPIGAIAQQDVWAESYNAKQADSLRAALQRTTNDTIRMRLSRSMGCYYQEMNWDSSLYYSQIQLNLAKKLKFKIWEADALDIIGWLLSNQKNYPQSLPYFLEGFKILKDKDCEKNIWNIKIFATDGKSATARLHSLAMIYNDISQLYKATGNKDKELANLVEGLNIGKSIRSYDVLAITQNNLATLYLRIDKPDSALLYARESLINMEKASYKTYQGDDLNVIGTVYLKKKDYKLARQYFDESIKAYRAQHVLTATSNTYLSLADLFRVLGKPDSSIYYAKKALADDRHLGLFLKMNDAYSTLYNLYSSTGNADSAYFYLRLYKALNDSLTKAEKQKLDAYQNVGFNEQIKSQQEKNELIQRANTIRIYVLIAAIVIFMIIAFLLYRNNRTRRKANELLEKQNEEIEKQKRTVEGTLTELRSTQTQLIQSEKMASLGELTAGIAHEIQNPLNFVNNFSDVSRELMEELKEELDKGDTEEAKAIATDVVENLGKITHHGKRADAIVKGMLQHSQAGSGIKELTDINALAEECMRLSYHRLRAKNASFNSEIISHLDTVLPKINAIPQDISRVLLNLFNNAFYAVNQRSKIAGADYKPEVMVTTSAENGHVIIKVKDNGVGIPDGIKEKIMQPFFTTKPTGEGTGLGLSLTYDMVVKGHGGNIQVNSVEGDGSEFIIKLPLTN